MIIIFLYFRKCNGTVAEIKKIAGILNNCGPLPIANEVRNILSFVWLVYGVFIFISSIGNRSSLPFPASTCNGAVTISARKSRRLQKMWPSTMDMVLSLAKSVVRC